MTQVPRLFLSKEQWWVLDECPEWELVPFKFSFESFTLPLNEPSLDEHASQLLEDTEQKKLDLQ